MASGTYQIQVPNSHVQMVARMKVEEAMMHCAQATQMQKLAEPALKASLRVPSQ